MLPRSLVRVFHTKLEGQLSDDIREEYLSLLPPEIREKNRRYRFWQDQHRHLFGVTLLLHALKQLGYSKDILKNLKYNQYGRPNLPVDVDFNISHSGDHVLVAISESLQVGVDVEEIHPVLYKEFTQVMSEAQLKFIEVHPNPTKCFYNYWTVKESIIKAIGTGLSDDVKAIRVYKDCATFKGNVWYLNTLDLGQEVCATLATNAAANCQLETISFYDKQPALQ